MKFKPSLAAEEFIENIHQRVGARTKAVLGRSALFLALGESVPPGFKPADSQGKDLDDETVIGDELRDVVRAALNHHAGKELDTIRRDSCRRYSKLQPRTLVREPDRTLLRCQWSTRR